MIEGIPDGWELVRIGQVIDGEHYLGMNGKILLCEGVFDGKSYVVIRKIEKPKKYRPFASADEFKPHRYRWVTRKDKSDKEAQPGAFLVAAYDDDGYWCSGGVHERFDFAFSHGRCFDDDGAPFGVKIDES